MVTLATRRARKAESGGQRLRRESKPRGAEAARGEISQVNYAVGNMTMSARSEAASTDEVPPVRSATIETQLLAVSLSQVPHRRNVPIVQDINEFGAEPVTTPDPLLSAAVRRVPPTRAGASDSGRVQGSCGLRLGRRCWRSDLVTTAQERHDSAESSDADLLASFACHQLTRFQPGSRQRK